MTLMSSSISMSLAPPRPAHVYLSPRGGCREGDIEAAPGPVRHSTAGPTATARRRQYSSTIRWSSGRSSVSISPRASRTRAFCGVRVLPQLYGSFG